MPTERLAFTPDAVRRAAEAIRAGGLVAFPTETVYGLGARADDGKAVRRIFEAKGRPADNPLIVHVLGIAAARELAGSFPEEAVRLAEAFWPGPLTLVVPKAPWIPDEVTARGPTIAVRVPAHPAARALLGECGLPIAAPSANRSASISPTTADHVLKTLDNRIDLVLDAGPTGYGIESTIVDVSRRPAVLLRHGALPLDAIAAHTPIVDRGAAVVGPDERPIAPGAYARHYAPRARLILVPRESVSAEAARRREAGERVGVLERNPPTAMEGWVEVLPADPVGYAAVLYAALHRLDDAGCQVIVAAEPPAGATWAAVRDRLRRATAPA